MKAQFQENMVTPKGFIGAIFHTSEATFVPVGDGQNQGYMVIDENSVLQEYYLKNMIVAKASVMIAKRMRPGASWGSGIGYLEVGTGVGTGTTQNPQTEQVDQVALRSPLFRKAITSWTYLDNDQPTAAETNVIQYTTTFDEIEAVGAITEMGLFGGDATDILGSGYMFNSKTFSVWNKQSNMKLTIVWKITY